MYETTKDAIYADYAEKLEDKLDAVIDDFQTLHHDVGFMWLLPSVADYRLTGNQRDGLYSTVRLEEFSTVREVIFMRWKSDNYFYFIAIYSGFLYDIYIRIPDLYKGPPVQSEEI